MKLVILDRDGVINRDSDEYIKCLAEWLPIEGSIEAIARLNQAGFTVAVATNQSGLGRGYFDLDELEAMHARLNELVNDAGGEIDGIFSCAHKPDDGCNCRKPAAGLLDTIAEELKAELTGAVVIGDSLRDLEAGIARNCLPILVRTGKGADTEKKLAGHRDSRIKHTQVFEDLATAAKHLITQQNHT